MMIAIRPSQLDDPLEGRSATATKRRATTDVYENIVEWIEDQPEAIKNRLRAALDVLAVLFRTRQNDDLRWWHRVGRLVEALQPPGDRHYGGNVMGLPTKHLQADLDLKRNTILNLLYHTRAFASKYSWRDAQSLDKLRREGRLTPKHVVALLSLKDERRRKSFLKQCLKEESSATELRREIQNWLGQKRGFGGRSPTVSRNVSPGVALQDLTKLARRWNMIYEAWFVGERASLGSDAIDIADEDMLKKVETAIQALTEVRSAVQDQLGRLRQIERAIKKTNRLRQKQRLQTP